MDRAKTILAVGLLAAFFLLAACGGDDDSEAALETEAATEPEQAAEPPEASPTEAKPPEEQPAEAEGPAELGTIVTVAGTGIPGTSGDGGLATEADLDRPFALAFDEAGNLYIGQGSGVVRRVDPDGVITTVAGTGVPGYSGDGGPATDAEINEPDLTFDAEGNLYILQFATSALRKVDSGGIITTVAGTGKESRPEDGSRASDSDVCGHPWGPLFDAERNTYITCELDHAVIEIDSEGIISTFAGTGKPGFSGDGGPASEADLFAPAGLALAPDGSIYVADVANSRIRRIDTGGIITTIAGTGESGHTGDGGPATEAQLTSVSFLTFDSEGNLYFSDHKFETDIGNRVRKIDTDGVITTVAGTGEAGFSGDGGPATEAELKWPQEVAFDAEGNLYIADYSNHRVRKVTLKESAAGAAGY